MSLWCHYENLSVVKGLIMLDLTLTLLLLLKQTIGLQNCFSLITWCSSVTFKFWVTLEFIRRHGKRQIKHFDFDVENKPNGRTCKFQYQWLEIVGRLEEIYIETSIAFLKCCSIYIKQKFRLCNVWDNVRVLNFGMRCQSFYYTLNESYNLQIVCFCLIAIISECISSEISCMLMHFRSAVLWSIYYEMHSFWEKNKKSNVWRKRYLNAFSARF